MEKNTFRESGRFVVYKSLKILNTAANTIFKKLKSSLFFNSYSIQNQSLIAFCVQKHFKCVVQHEPVVPSYMVQQK
jgi:hypothetical protein